MGEQMKYSMLLLIIGASLPNIAAAQSFSSQNNGTGVVTLPGQNFVQSTMSDSIDSVCPPINKVPVKTPSQADLANVCSTMIGTAFNAQGQPNPPLNAQGQPNGMPL